jgi:hypothetical protein
MKAAKLKNFRTKTITIAAMKFQTYSPTHDIAKRPVKEIASILVECMICGESAEALEILEGYARARLLLGRVHASTRDRRVLSEFVKNKKDPSLRLTCKVLKILAQKKPRKK